MKCCFSFSVDTFACPYDGYFADPTNCRRFYRCSGHTKRAFSCPDGLAFSSSKVMCKRIEEVTSCDAAHSNVLSSASNFAKSLESDVEQKNRVKSLLLRELAKRIRKISVLKDSAHERLNLSPPPRPSPNNNNNNNNIELDSNNLERLRQLHNNLQRRHNQLSNIENRARSTLTTNQAPARFDFPTNLQSHFRQPPIASLASTVRNRPEMQQNPFMQQNSKEMMGRMQTEPRFQMRHLSNINRQWRPPGGETSHYRFPEPPKNARMNGDDFQNEFQQPSLRGTRPFRNNAHFEQNSMQSNRVNDGSKPTHLIRAPYRGQPRQNMEQEEPAGANSFQNFNIYKKQASQMAPSNSVAMVRRRPPTSGAKELQQRRNPNLGK